MTTARIFHEGLHFGECPRWHDGVLWYSDFHDHAVHRITMDARDERTVEFSGQPSGLGWLPDGSLLISSMLDRTIVHWDGQRVADYADLSAHATFHVNDLIVDRAGRAYAGNFGFDLDRVIEEFGHAGLFTEPGTTPAVLCRIDPDRSVHVAAEDLVFPNGMVITPDGNTMIVAETLAFRLTAFDIGEDGSLSNRRVWADLSERIAAPDGICLDAGGAVWIANGAGPACLRIAEGGEVLDEVATSQPAFACMLGGPEGRHLFVMTAPSSDHKDRSASRDGLIEVAEVAVPHAGLP